MSTPVSFGGAAPIEFDFEDEQLDEQAVRDRVWEEVSLYHAEFANNMVF
jgi:hypothetical protein